MDSPTVLSAMLWALVNHGFAKYIDGYEENSPRNLRLLSRISSVDAIR